MALHLVISAIGAGDAAAFPGNFFFGKILAKVINIWITLTSFEQSQNLASP